MCEQSSIAIVVPVLDDMPRLRALVSRIRDWPEQPHEIIVVSATQDPELLAYCEINGCRYLNSVRCRGTQLDNGARCADASVLWFLHADAAPYPSSLHDITLALAEGAESGYFRFMFAGPSSWRKKFIEWSVKLRTRLGGTPYGDQGLFMRRQVYLECGGFPHTPLFEEVALVRKLRARKRFWCLKSPIGVSPRRWEHDGWTRRSLTNRYLAIRYMFGTTAKQLSLSYDQTNKIPRGAQIRDPKQ